MIRIGRNLHLFVYSLHDQRLRALARTRESIFEMENVLRELSPDSSQRLLVKGLLKSLHSAEARLVGGLIVERPKVSSG